MVKPPEGGLLFGKGKAPRRAPRKVLNKRHETQLAYLFEHFRMEANPESLLILCTLSLRRISFEIFEPFFSKLNSIKKCYKNLAITSWKCDAFSAWVMSDATALLKDTAGNYLWNGTTETLLGKPVYTSCYMPDAAEGQFRVYQRQAYQNWCGKNLARSSKML